MSHAHWAATMHPSKGADSYERLWYAIYGEEAKVMSDKRDKIPMTATALTVMEELKQRMAYVAGLEARIELLEGEIRAIQSPEGIRNIIEQYEAQLQVEREELKHLTKPSTT